MNIPEFAFVTSRPYASELREVNVSGQAFLSKELAFDMQTQELSQ